MKRQLIEMHQEFLIQCDNKVCDYKIKNESGDPNENVSDYLNMPCPKCGENLLTEEDYLQSLRFLKIINWINKWFSWTLIFYSKNAKKKSIKVHHHKGVNIIKDED